MAVVTKSLIKNREKRFELTQKLRAATDSNNVNDAAMAAYPIATREPNLQWGI